jgi:hypothetical protein
VGTGTPAHKDVIAISATSADIYARAAPSTDT